MRIHADTLTAPAIRAALADAQTAGRIAPHVYLRTLTEHRSQSHARAFEVSLAGTQADPGRRRGNDGAYGAMTDGYAATFDEWGWFLAGIYAADGGAVCGSVKSPVYRDRVDYHVRTGYTYAPDELLRMIEVEGGDPYPYRSGRDQVGRRGANRSDGDFTASGYAVPRYAVEQADDGVRGSWLTLAPRTADWVRAFASGAVR